MIMKKSIIIYLIMMSVGVFIVMMTGVYINKMWTIESPMSLYLMSGALVVYLLITNIVFIRRILKLRKLQ